MSESMKGQRTSVINQKKRLLDMLDRFHPIGDIHDPAQVQHLQTKIQEKDAEISALGEEIARAKREDEDDEPLLLVADFPEEPCAEQTIELAGDGVTENRGILETDTRPPARKAMRKNGIQYFQFGPYAVPFPSQRRVNKLYAPISRLYSPQSVMTKIFDRLSTDWTTYRDVAQYAKNNEMLTEIVKKITGLLAGRLQRNGWEGKVLIRDPENMIMMVPCPEWDGIIHPASSRFKKSEARRLLPSER